MSQSETNDHKIWTFAVDAAEPPERLDRWLASKTADISRARIQMLIRDGQVERAGQTIGDASLRVKPGDVFTLREPPPADLATAAEHIALSIVFEDDALIVIDKPAGLVVHPGAGHQTGTLVNALLAHCGGSLSGIGGVKRPGIVHRLDKDTSGLLVVAKTDAAHLDLSEQFQSHGADGRLYRAYLALVWGRPQPPVGRIEARLARSVANRQKIAVVRGLVGRHAVTHYEIAESFAGHSSANAVTLLSLQLETGRTHQIRVHLAHSGYPILADPLYGAYAKTKVSTLQPCAQTALGRLNRQALHAAELGFQHPKTGRKLRFSSEIPADIAAVINALRQP